LLTATNDNDNNDDDDDDDDDDTKTSIKPSRKHSQVTIIYRTLHDVKRIKRSFFISRLWSRRLLRRFKWCH